MVDDLTQREGQEVIRQLSRIVAKELVRGGHPEAIIQALIARGIPEHEARSFVIEIEQIVEDVKAPAQGVPLEALRPEVRAALEYLREQPRQMIRGLVVAGLGLVIMLVAFSSIPNLPQLAALVFILPVIYGGFEFASGFYGWWRLRRSVGQPPRR